MKKKGFTLVELLAVIVILAIILVIAVPQITKVIKQTRVNAITSTAKLILSKAEEKEVENEALEISDSITCTDLVSLDDNYDSANCTIAKNSTTGEWEVSIAGATGKKFEGISVFGTKDNLVVTDNQSGNNSNNNSNNNVVSASCSGSSTGIGLLEDGLYIVARDTGENPFMDFGEQLPSGTLARSTPAAAMNDWIGYDYGPSFYTIVKLNNDNEIVEGYVGFTVTDRMAEENPGMVPGTYYLKGGDNGAAYNDNLNVLKTAFGCETYTNYCGESLEDSEYGAYIDCYSSYYDGSTYVALYADADNSVSPGLVNAGYLPGDNTHCTVQSGDPSQVYCYG